MSNTPNEDADNTYEPTRGPSKESDQSVIFISMNSPPPGKEKNLPSIYLELAHIVESQRHKANIRIMRNASETEILEKIDEKTIMFIYIGHYRGGGGRVRILGRVCLRTCRQREVARVCFY